MRSSWSNILSWWNLAEANIRVYGSGSLLAGRWASGLLLLPCPALSPHTVSHEASPGACASSDLTERRGVTGCAPTARSVWKPDPSPSSGEFILFLAIRSGVARIPCSISRRRRA
eukprot:CAMPEP_0175470630 /NCGR_PEP_ID=MMETSP0095-20121207/72943_1 /TAXON_ID=311494 /ORGANISM="Alexandrium monilatum, Strain CCMP3105" /LENGTH=114 /DNA_ID=CAMNT_0016772057 /DNA_START=41 /DNA_END=381 /DNA_ORIENTATION=+